MHHYKLTYSSHPLQVKHRGDSLSLHLTTVCVSGLPLKGTLSSTQPHVAPCFKPQRSHQEHVTTLYRLVYSVCYILFIDSSHRLQEAVKGPNSLNLNTAWEGQSSRQLNYSRKSDHRTTINSIEIICLYRELYLNCTYDNKRFETLEKLS